MTPHIAVILTDAQRRILWVNQSFTKLTGYAMSEVMGKVPGTFLQGPASELDVIERLKYHLQKNLPVKDTITNYRKNGEAYKCKLLIYPIFNPGGKLINFIAFEVDEKEVPDDSNIPMLQLKEKYETSALKRGDEIFLFSRLQDLLIEKKLYLKPDIHLWEVAQELKTNTKYLSQVVNHQSGGNFQHYLNIYRVEEAKQKIIDPHFSHLTLYGVALQCGFKNKSTFYKVFKEITGVTPNVFMKQHAAREFSNKKK